MPLALLTGATGFVGGAVLRELLARGWGVRVLHRPGSPQRNLEGLGAPFERWIGDLRDLASLREAAAGCDFVFHVAARYQFGLGYSRAMYRDNVEGTCNVLAAAAAARVRRIVYTSTVGVLHARADGVPVDEACLASIEQLAGPYKRSKWLAEQEVLRAAREGLPVVTVCPSAPVGPCDVKPTPTGKMILDFVRGRMPAYVDTGLNLVAVEDAAVGHVLAAERGEVGQRYILGHENLSFRAILEMLSSITGRSPPRLRVPRRLLVPLSYVSEGVSLVLRRAPAISLENARMAQSYMYFDCSRAVRELGFSPGSVRRALERAVDWFEENGYVSRRPLSTGPSRNGRGAREAVG